MVIFKKKSSRNDMTLKETKSSASLIKSTSTNLSVDLFHNLLTPNYENLESLCLTKKRVLESLKITNPEITEDILTSQYEKDLILNTVNKKILSLRFKLLAKSKSTKENLWKKITSNIKNKHEVMQKELKIIEENLKSLKEEINKKQKAIEEEKVQHKEKIKNLESEVEELKYSSEGQSEILNETKTDLAEIEKIFEGMNEINKSIEEKMEEKRKEIKELNKNYYESVGKSFEIDQLEGLYKETIEKKRISAQKREKLQKKLSKIEKFYKNIKNYPKRVEELFNRLIGTKDFLENILDEHEISKWLLENRALIEELKQILNVSIPKPLQKLLNENFSDFSSEIKDSQKKLMKLNENLANIQKNAINKTFEDTIKLSDYSENKNLAQIKNLSQEILGFKEKSKSLKQKFENLMHENQKKTAEMGQINRRIDLNNSKMNFLNTLKKNEINKQEELKNLISSMSRKNEKSQNSVFDKESPSNDRKLSNIITQVTYLHEEILKKDTQIIKRTRELLKTEEDIHMIEGLIANFEKKMNETKEEIYAKFSDEIEKKDKEIQMLKEILKGNSNEIKSKDASLKEIKKKLENVEPLMRPVHDNHRYSVKMV